LPLVGKNLHILYPVITEQIDNCYERSDILEQ